MNKYINIQNIEKSFDEGRIKALRGVSFSINKGEFISIMGPSGCGKSTLLNMIGALDTPDTGQVFIDGVDVTSTKIDNTEYRSKKIGFIFQLHNLISSLTALENVQIPMLGISSKEKEKKARNLLKLVGLSDRGDNLPTKLSGGERQKVAVARALANDPQIIIADEPTGSLDSKSSETVMGLLKKIHKDREATIILVTHSKHVASYADRIVEMLDGMVKT